MTERINNLDKEYQRLLQDILDNGVEKADRTGTGTISVFGRQIRHKMSEGFPLLTTKKMYWRGIVTELLWFLRGDTNIKWLVDNGCNIWNGDAMKNYEKKNGEIDWGPFITKEEAFVDSILNVDGFAEQWGELGPIYGKQWRSWANGGEVFDSVHYHDQIANLINDLKTNPDSRRLVVSAWNVGELDQMVLPPCHYGFQVYTTELTSDERKKLWTKTIGKSIHYASNFTDEDLDKKGVPSRKLSLMWNQRSVDTFLGLPFNIASYGLLLEIIAKEVNMIPDELIGNLGDVHLYKNHIEQAVQQIRKLPYELPHVIINDEFWNPDADLISQIDHIEVDDFWLEEYQSHERIIATLNN